MKSLIDALVYSAFVALAIAICIVTPRNTHDFWRDFVGLWAGALVLWFITWTAQAILSEPPHDDSDFGGF